MVNKINISIPQPCHENWDAMTATDKGGFCASCQKDVFDFTKASDREIIKAFEKDHQLCGRFLNTQLNRDLIKPEKKSSLWLATTSSLFSFIGLGTYEAQAQGEVKMEQTDRKFRSVKTDNDTILVAGIVYDENKTPRPHLGIYIGNYKVGETNSSGNFSIYTHLRARIVFRNVDEDNDESSDYYVKNDCCSNIEINTEEIKWITKSSHTVGGAVYYKKRSFFGRIFHSIGNWFR
jgi:hypothetical protein